jgi:hypothetical protein
MPRNIDPVLLAALTSDYVEIVDLVLLTFRSQVCCSWSGIGDLAWNGRTFLGVGSLGVLGDVAEGTEVRADGTTVGLSGIDPIYLGEALNDIRLGGPAMRWIGAVEPGTRTLIGTPYLLFSGQVDKPTIHTGAETCGISLALETRMINHSRASNRRYTTADQHANGYPDDTSFDSVEKINDEALLWGSKG